jgi:hypothetical protein
LKARCLLMPGLDGVSVRAFIGKAWIFDMVIPP